MARTATGTVGWVDPVQLRPLRATEIVDAATVVCRSEALALATLTAVVIVPTAGLATVPLALGGSATSFAVAGAIAVAGGLLALAAAVHLTGRLLLGEEVSWRRSLRVAGRRSGAIAVLAVQVLVATAIGVVGAFVGALWVAAGAVPALPALLLEPATPRVARRRARILATDRRTAIGAAVGLALALIVVAGAVVWMLLDIALVHPSVASEATRWATAAIAVVVVSIGGLPLLGATLVLCYTDTRVRREGLDIQFQLDAALRRSPPAEALR